jgi:hypothetical protein
LDAVRIAGQQDREVTIMRNEREIPDQTIAAWRNGTDPSSPAGPLFTSGDYAQSEITMHGRVGTGDCGTVCSGSAAGECC